MENKHHSTSHTSSESDVTTIVFIHYFGGSAESWKWLIGILSLNYKCVAINLPGFGNTTIHHEPNVEYYADFIEQELIKLDIKHCVLVGHSMGGKIACQVALDLSSENTIQQLILLAPSPPTIERMSDEVKQRMLQHPNIEVEKETVHRVTVKPLTNEQFNLAVKTQEIIDTKVWRWWIIDGMNTPLSEKTKELKLPITVIASDDDAAITPQMIKNDVMPNLPIHTKLITTNGLGHLIPMEAPEWLAKTIQSVF